MRQIQQNKGQTLVEIVVIIAILGISLSAMVVATTYGIKTSRVARERSEARHIADNELEDIRTIRNQSQADFFLVGANTDYSETAGVNAMYSVDVVFTTLTVGEEVEVSVLVTWQDGGDVLTVEQSSILSKWE